jgi:hypothetical protein
MEGGIIGKEKQKASSGFLLLPKLQCSNISGWLANNSPPPFLERKGGGYFSHNKSLTQINLHHLKSALDEWWCIK